MTAPRFIRSLPDACGRSLAVFLRDVGQGLLEVSHNTLALVGLAVVAVLVFAGGRPDVRASVEQYAYDWLHARQEAKAEREGNLLAAFTEPDAVARATAADPHDLTRQQAAVATWISQRYHVAPEPISRLVQESWSVGQRAGLDPTLILAIMAVESSFNPFAQSSVGAQGLMQVMTRVHDAKYEVFGGRHAAFDPVTNLRVGVQVLKECIQRAGGLEAGLRFYVGAANLEDDGGYVTKVLAEQVHLKQVAGGQRVSPFVPMPTTTARPAPDTDPAPSNGAPKEAAAQQSQPQLQRVALAR
jgi:hypothetical protein